MKNQWKVNYFLSMDDLRIYPNDRMALESLIIASGSLVVISGWSLNYKNVLYNKLTENWRENCDDMVISDQGDEDLDYTYLGVLDCDTVKSEKVQTLKCD